MILYNVLFKCVETTIFQCSHFCTEFLSKLSCIIDTKMGFGKVGGMDFEVMHIIVEALLKDVLLTSCRFHILTVNWVVSWIYLGECVTSVYCMQNCHYYLAVFFSWLVFLKCVHTFFGSGCIFIQ